MGNVSGSRLVWSTYSRTRYPRPRLAGGNNTASSTLRPACGRHDRGASPERGVQSKGKERIKGTHTSVDIPLHMHPNRFPALHTRVRYNSRPHDDAERVGHQRTHYQNEIRACAQHNDM